MGAAYLCGMCGIQQETIQNNAAYIKSWIRTFKDDSKILVMAAAQAQNAVNYIINQKLEPAPVAEMVLWKKALRGLFLFFLNFHYLLHRRRYAIYESQFWYSN